MKTISPKLWPGKRQVAVIAAATTAFVAGSYGVTLWSFHYSSTTRFCVSCHEMGESYRQYRESSHAVNDRGVVAECADCHLPPGTVDRWRAKIMQGVKDSVVHVLSDPAEMDREEWRRQAVRNIHPDSCRECHKDLLPPALPKGGLIAHRAFLNGRANSTCLDCHENLVHVDKGDRT
ncbi:MAG: NapC/NirT family cytochrome c [Nitrospirae bacterium]|nr:NapC/NirT family cytochrome c [Nitrospirota bacterium]